MGAMATVMFGSSGLFAFPQMLEEATGHAFWVDFDIPILQYNCHSEVPLIQVN